MGGAPAGIANYLKNFPEIAGQRYYSALLGSVEVISLDYTSPSGPLNNPGPLVCRSTGSYSCSGGVSDDPLPPPMDG